MMEGSYREASREIPVTGSYEVIVAGGGPAGCAAALAAARLGARVLLIEKEGFLGGAPATQFVTSILSTNGVDFQGIWHELIREVKSLDGVTGLVHHPKPLAEYILCGLLDPEAVKFAWDRLLEKAGVALLHYSLVAGAVVEAGKLQGVIVENVAGRQVIYGKRVVDCTGDGSVCHQAGVAWEQGNGEEKYGMACNFCSYLGGIKIRTACPGEDQMKKIERQWKEMKNQPEFIEMPVHAGSLAGFGIPHGKRIQPHGRCAGPGGKFLYEVDALKAEDLTRAVREGRKYIWAFTRLLSACVDEQAEAYVAATPNQLGVRATRRICGRQRMTREDVWDFRKYPDGIARGSFDIDIYNPRQYEGWSVPRHTPEYRERILKMKRGEYYDIRYGAIVASGVDNLLMAGRCISADYVAQSSLRIQQTCIATGQAAGTAAAMSLNEGVAPGALDPGHLAARLEKDRRVEPAFDELKDV